MSVLLCPRTAYFVLTVFSITCSVCSDESQESLKDTMECSSGMFREIMVKLIKSLRIQIDDGGSNASTLGSSVATTLLPTVPESVVTEVVTTTLSVWFRNQLIPSVITSTIVHTFLPASSTEELELVTSTITPENRGGRRVREIEVEPSFALFIGEPEVQYIIENSRPDKIVEDPRVIAAINKLKMVLQQVYEEHNRRESGDGNKIGLRSESV